MRGNCPPTLVVNRILAPDALPTSTATVADGNPTGDKRGLLDAPPPPGPRPASAPPLAAHAAEEGLSPLEDNLLGEEDEAGEGKREEGEGFGLLTTETTRGARLAVEDVSVVTPTGGVGCRVR